MREINRIVLHHSASAAGTHTWAEIKAWHLAKGWSDIGYHFGIVDDGGTWHVEPGRPVESVGAHAKGFNEGSLGICFEGNFDAHRMPAQQFEAGLQLVAQLTQRFRVPFDRILGHRQLPYSTACPGKYFPLQQMQGGLRDIINGRWPN